MTWNERTKKFYILAHNTLKSTKSVIFLTFLFLFISIFNVYITWKSDEAKNQFIAKFSKDWSVKYKILMSLNRFLVFILIHYTCSSLNLLIESILKTLIAEKAMRDANREMLQMNYFDFHMKGLGEMQNLIVNSSWALADIIIMILVNIPTYFIGFVYVTIKITQLLNRHCVVWYLLLSSLSFIFAVLINIYIFRKQSLCWNLFRNSLNYLTDNLSHFDVVKAFNKVDKEIYRYQYGLNKYKKETINLYKWQEILQLTQKFSILIPHFLVYYLAVGTEKKPLNLENILNYNSLFISFKSNFLKLRNCCFFISTKMVEIEYRLNSNNISLSKKVIINDFLKSIKFKNVDLFAGNMIANKDLTFEINKGDIIGITGVNGAGKSVFFKTLLRFYNSSRGITIDGIPIENIDEESLRDLISYVPQDPNIFNNTVLYNLGYSQEKNNVEEIYRVCKKYGYHDFFMKLPNGYFTETGENGKNLSGGQKQKINFMRAIIKNAPILLLDEPTSNIDYSSEMKLLESLFKHSNGKTILVILHNLNLLKNFQKIIYFDKNKVKCYDSYETYILNK